MLKSTLLAAGIAAAFTFTANAQEAPKPAAAPAARRVQPLEIREIRDGVYWAHGGVGGNSGVIVGKDGVTVIDAKQTPDTAKDMIAKIAAITNKPIKQIILTGTGGEGIPGLAGFPKGLPWNGPPVTAMAWRWSKRSPRCSYPRRRLHRLWKRSW